MTHEIECLLFERWIDKVFSNLQRFRRLDKEMDKILYNLLHERREGQHFRSSEATSCKLTWPVQNTKDKKKSIEIQKSILDWYVKDFFDMMNYKFFFDRKLFSSLSM